MFEEHLARLRQCHASPVGAQQVDSHVVSQRGQLLGHGTGGQRQ